MSEWFEELAGTLDMVWARLAAGLSDADAPARYPAFCNVGAGASAEARIVRLRGAARAEGVVSFHTDLMSQKVAQLARNDRASLVIWDAPLAFQIRLRVRAVVSSGAEVAHLWPQIPPASQRAYGGQPPPGREIPDPGAHDPAIDPARLAVVTCRIDEIDTVNLTEPRHHRALFRRSDGFAGSWLAP